MTCLYALEHGNLSDIVTFSDRAASAPKVHLGARAGSQFLLSVLLYALMLESYNDAAVAIAEHLGGSVEAFCQVMASWRNSQPESTLDTGSNIQNTAAVLAPRSWMPFCSKATAKNEVQTATIKVYPMARGGRKKLIFPTGISTVMSHR